MNAELYSSSKALVSRLRRAMYDFSETNVCDVLDDVLSDDVIIHLAHPLGDMTGADQYYKTAYGPLLHAVPDLERRDYIVIGGNNHVDGQSDEHWVGCAGYYTGTFTKSWLDIPPTGHMMHMRFHEFYRVENDQIIEIQALWDIPELMMQAGAWPMTPSLGRQWHAPAPATQDGVVDCEPDFKASLASQNLVIDMLTHMQKHPHEGGPEIMQLERFWHPRMSWYGPSGIGTARGIAGFRKHHQIPFLKAMPDRGQYPDEANHHFFADHHYVAVTGWPNMVQTITGDGWLGLNPTGAIISLRSLDFWRIEDNLIRENWVLVDILDVYRQLGVDVFARMREMNGIKQYHLAKGSMG